jgi:hypothetical protein
MRQKDNFIDKKVKVTIACLGGHQELIGTVLYVYPKQDKIIKPELRGKYCVAVGSGRFLDVSKEEMEII